jgi:CRISPR-associated Csx2 family protein
MTHTLISFLGRGNPDKGKRYRKATYSFGPDQRQITEFFGLGLVRQIKPDRLMILGTTGSMWDVLLFSLGLGAEHDDALLALTESADADRTTQEELDSLVPVVSERLGLTVILRLIPYGRDLTEQLNILTIMASHLKPGHQASLDVTHGLRHLPMLAQLSALYLRSAVKVDIQGIYYGALDMTQDGLTPVMNLSGLLRIADWVGALHTFDKDGDYGAFADLMEQDGLPGEKANHLRRAAFRERTSNAWEARTDLRNLDVVLESGLPGVSALFADQLRDRICWYKGQDLQSWQRELALEYLQRGDYIRSTIYAFESFVTSLVDPEQGEQVWNYEDRQKAREEYRDGLRGKQSLKKDYNLLSALRNGLAHGTRSMDEKLGKKVERIMSNPESLRDELQRLIKKLLNHRG